MFTVFFLLCYILSVTPMLLGYSMKLRRKLSLHFKIWKKLLISKKKVKNSGTHHSVKYCVHSTIYDVHLLYMEVISSYGDIWGCIHHRERVKK